MCDPCYWNNMTSIQSFEQNKSFPNSNPIVEHKID